MIKIESILINDFRGIRELEISLGRENYVVHGPNGSGKSGIVDAIQFALTGDISRLRGAGTSELTISDHGPHILARTTPETAWVKLHAFIPSLNLTASIERSVKRPTQPKIEPKSAEVVAIFNSVAEHPEISLSRREIIKFILSADGQRSTDVQGLLRLSAIGTTRLALLSASNKLLRTKEAARTTVAGARLSLLSHLGLSSLNEQEMLKAVNARRAILSLDDLTEIEASTSFTEGLQMRDQGDTVRQGRDSVIKDLDIFTAIISSNLDGNGVDVIAEVITGLDRLAGDPALERSIKRLVLLETGADLIDAEECPLCETNWSSSALRALIARRLQESRNAVAVRDAIEFAGSRIAAMSRHAASVAELLERIPEADGTVREALTTWRSSLLVFATGCEAFESIKGLRDRLSAGWARMPTALSIALPQIRERVLARPAQTALGEARDFLTVAQERLTKWRAAASDSKRREVEAERAKRAYDVYVQISDSTLLALYETVESDFSAYYRAVNEEDEGQFSAKLTPAESTLRLDVDFFGHGLCPPGAYHSEGHQDGMGLCLFLALAKQSLGGDFTLVVLDDVVMSVDSGHRRNICRLLKANFPDTQFVITTHDQVWARQMRNEGLVSARNSLAFHSWDVQTGPVVNEVNEVWARIERDLEIDDVPSAAAKLRRHLEFVSGELADLLVAQVPYRGDNAYDLGDLFPAVVSRQKGLIGAAAKAANSWNQQDAFERVGAFKVAHTAAHTRQSDEAWMINKSVHFVEWANLTAAEFRPLVSAFHAFLATWRCTACDTWLALSSRHNAKSLSCACDATRFNLAAK